MTFFSKKVKKRHFKIFEISVQNGRDADFTRKNGRENDFPRPKSKKSRKMAFQMRKIANSKTPFKIDLEPSGPL